MIKSSLPRFALALLALALTVLPAALHAEEASGKKLTKNQQKYDADQDGKLSEEEKAAAKEAAKAKGKETREANLDKYDANKDGKLDADERAKKKSDEQTEKESRKAERDAKKAAKEAEQAK